MRAKVLKLLKLMDVEWNMDHAVKGVIQKWTAFNGPLILPKDSLKEIEKSPRILALYGEIAAAYEALFTEEQVDGLIAWFEGPLGKIFVKHSRILEDVIERTGAVIVEVVNQEIEALKKSRKHLLS